MKNLSKPCSTFGIFAPGSACEPERLSSGVSYIGQLGFKVKIFGEPSLHYGSYEYGFASQSVAQRIDAFNQAVADQTVSAIIAVRGGYGAMQLLPQIDFSALAKSKKPLIGYSDITSLLLPAYQKGANVIHGATIAAEFSNAASDNAAKESAEALINLLDSAKVLPQFSVRILREGKATGKIIAGNLTCITALLGTPWDISFDKSILCLEDVGEKPYRIHRLLQQLKLAGKLDNLAGLVFGRFHNCSAEAGPKIEQVLEMVVAEMLKGSSYPVLVSDDFGHYGKNLPLPLGCEAQISGNQFKLK